MIDYQPDRRNRRSVVAALGLIMLLSSACTSSPTSLPEEASAAPATPTLEPGQVITLGDIDANDPIKKIKRFQPLANYLAEHLKEFGVEQGRVVIARDMEEMAQFLIDGTADIYFDSASPTLNVQEISGSDVILRRWKGSAATYWSVYIARRNNGVSGVEELVGKVLAFEEPFSTSGFALPAGTLIQRGFTLIEVDHPDAFVPSDQIGYFFTGDEENTVELVLQGKVAAGGISNQDYEELLPELKQRIITLDRTIAVPRQLVSVRFGLEPGLVAKVRDLLIGLDQTPEGRQILEGLKQTQKFDLLPPDSEAALAEFNQLRKLLVVEK